MNSTEYTIATASQDCYIKCKVIDIDIDIDTDIDKMQTQIFCVSGTQLGEKCYTLFFFFFFIC